MIGKTVWVFDINRRKYREGIVGGQIWKEHWRPEMVESETSRSWITDLRTKIPKKDPDPRKFCFSEEDIDRQAWVHDHRRKIAEAVGRCHDADILKKVAELISYRPKKS